MKNIVDTLSVSLSLVTTFQSKVDGIISEQWYLTINRRGQYVLIKARHLLVVLVVNWKYKYGSGQGGAYL